MSRIGRRINLLAIITSLFAVSCTTESDGPKGDSRAICFTPNSGTRAVVNTDDDMTAGFCVWGWFGSDQISNNVFDGVIVSKSSNVWTYTGGTQYWLPGNTYNFYSVYPASVENVNITSNGTISINNFDCSATGNDAVDLMTASKTGMSGDAAEIVAFTFSHELAKIDVIIQAMLSVKVRIIDMKIYGISTSGNFTLNTTNKTRIWNELQTAVSSSNTPYSNTTEAELDGDGTTNQIAAFSELLLIPQSIRTAMLSITYQRDGETTPTTKEIALNRQTSAWNAGNTYRYTLLIEADNITFSGFSVEQWDIRYSGGDINIGA